MCGRGAPAGDASGEPHGKAKGLKGTSKKSSLSKGPGVEGLTVQKQKAQRPRGGAVWAEAGEASWRQGIPGETGHRKGGRLYSRGGCK